jgi:enolase
MKITKLIAREILDSRGNPTLEVTCELDDKYRALAAVPSGASTGVHEAVELRDKEDSRYRGLGVLQAAKNVNVEIFDFVKEKSFDQRSLDETLVKLDGTKDKSKLGANAILGVSLAFAKASAVSQNLELFEYIGKISGNTIFSIPTCMFNIINGGKHADSGLDVQEFMICPVGIKTFSKQLQAASEVTQSLKKILSQKGYTVGVGDEGGFAPHLKSNEEALELIQQAIAEAKYSNEEIKIAVDVAASSLYSDKMCTLKIDGKEECLSSVDLVSWYEKLVDKYGIISIEDGLSEDDFNGFALLNKKLGKNILVVGDDLTVTNVERIKQAKQSSAINSVLIKPNQIGTVTETIEAVNLTKEYGWKPFISHRSGETSDTFIADLAVGTSSPYLKSGAPVRGERVAKYNRLLEISDTIK